MTPHKLAQWVLDGKALATRLGRLPTARELRADRGSGSHRDATLAWRALNATLVKANSVISRVEPDAKPTNTVNAEDADGLRGRIVELERLLAATQEEHDGLRRHLLLETARLRDELRAEIGAPPIVRRSPVAQESALSEPIF